VSIAGGDTPVTFHYRAVDTGGRVRRGRIGARSRDAAMAELVAGGLHPIAISPEVRAASRRSALPMADTALALRILADLLDSGLPLARALATLETLASPAWQRMLPAVRQAVREGRSFAEALGERASLAHRLTHRGQHALPRRRRECLERGERAGKR